MAQTKDDEKRWQTALNNSFVQPPSQWTFNDNDLLFGNKLYRVDDVTSYELALLDIHAQYWEVNEPEHLRKYHRILQYDVEVYFESNEAEEVHQTPPFLRWWLIRVMLNKCHTTEGREQMLKTFNDMPEKTRIKLEQGKLESPIVS